MSVRSQKPIVQFNSAGLPHEFKRDGEWLVWCEDEKRPIKIGPFGNRKNHPEDWCPFNEVEKAIRGRRNLFPYLVLTDDLFITCFDIDRKPRRSDETEDECATRHKNALAAYRRLRETFPHSFVERSKSGKGLHLFVYGQFTGKNITSGVGAGIWSGVEVYCRAHGIAVTGKLLKSGKAAIGLEDHSKEVQELVDEIRPPSTKSDCPNYSESSVPVEEARRVLEAIAKKVGRPERGDWLRLASATRDGVGKEAAIELLCEIFPEEESNEYERLFASLPDSAPWETLRYFGVDPSYPGQHFTELPIPDAKLESSNDYEFEIVRERTAFDPSKPPPKPIHVLFFKGKAACSEGNLAVLQGPTKAGKSGVISAIGGACLAEFHDISGDEMGDTLGFLADFTTSPNTQPAVLHLDTEQSAAHHFASIKRMEKRSGSKIPPIGFYSHYLTELGIEDRKRFLSDYLQTLKEGNESPALILLDGVADFCQDVNSIAEANELVRWLHRLAVKYECVILCVIHENPGTDIGKTRGHLGSELARKAETTFRVEKKEGKALLWVHESRVMEIPKTDGLCFAWDDKKGMHATVGDVREIQNSAKRAEFQEEVSDIFSGSESPFTFTELSNRIRQKLDASPSTAKRRIKDWVRLQLIEKVEGGYSQVSFDDDDL